VEREEGFEGDLGGRLLFGEDTEVVVVGGDYVENINTSL
jgi:hypothetical protein